MGVVLLAVVLAFGWLLGWLTVGEYKPADIETLGVGGTPSKTLYAGDTLRLVTWNIGYGALGDNADFFMDGGSMVRTADRARVEENMTGITEAVRTLAPDLLLLQEADRDSARSWHTDEAAALSDAFPGYQSTFAYNYRVMYVPYPVPPIGKVNSGLLTLSAYPVTRSDRVQLPCPFSWPVRLGNLKRCVMIDRIPIENSDRQLVVMNLHLEAYDDGEGKRAQTEMLRQLLQEEADAGNYVIAGGDFNQIFSSVGENPFPPQEGMWMPGVLDTEAFGGDWQFEMDISLPSCRSLDRPFAGEDILDFQYYLIDGFIVSRDIQVLSLNTQWLGFRNSDHNPVQMEVRLPVY